MALHFALPRFQMGNSIWVLLISFLNSCKYVEKKFKIDNSWIIVIQLWLLHDIVCFRCCSYDM